MGGINAGNTYNEYTDIMEKRKATSLILCAISWYASENMFT